MLLAWEKDGNRILLPSTPADQASARDARGAKKSMAVREPGNKGSRIRSAEKPLKTAVVRSLALGS